jgi:hypothetical protein
MNVLGKKKYLVQVADDGDTMINIATSVWPFYPGLVKDTEEELRAELKDYGCTPDRIDTAIESAKSETGWHIV